ncbi:MAG: bifunctional folylpolyglutamate synthase/dihydrofolate synthase [Lentisphaerae bacterium]|nr:bifunctional folylpolyglutamate synthase/dihydrofolate synthase [Lentisphaerota bacterium]
MITDLDQAVEWLTTLHRFGIKLGLEQTRKLAALCSSPEKELKFIHLAGTNGKGSTGAMLESALRNSGFVTGFYSSPHLISPCERFRVNGRAIDPDEFARSAEVVRQAAGKMRESGASVTYFEATTVMAMLIFLEHKCDYVIWETGMGGRLDSTNIVTPEVSVITNIALDHEKFLGSSIAEIAAEKAGIIKPGVPVVCGSLPEAARNVIRQRAGECGSVFTEVQTGRIDAVAQVRENFQSFSFENENIELSLNGPMQQRNSALAITVLKTLNLWNERARAGLKQTRWPGRMELLCDCRIMLDGGHNPDGLTALSETLRKLYPGKKFHWIFGAFADKDFTGGLQVIAPLAESLGAVSFAEEARLSAAPEDICVKAAGMGIGETFVIDDLPAYLDEIKQRERGEVPVVIAGSLYLAGEVLAHLEKDKHALDLH